MWELMNEQLAHPVLVLAGFTNLLYTAIMYEAVLVRCLLLVMDTTPGSLELSTWCGVMQGVLY
jgi:hypothetical protein